jgi:hypothetical protein
VTLTKTGLSAVQTFGPLGVKFQELDEFGKKPLVSLKAILNVITVEAILEN